jgi:eukaryotic-like serine/threonine-protein kinase
MPLAPGTKLGPYEIVVLLGAGGMGEVYRARDTRLDRIVAIKILSSKLATTPELKQRMEREARAISSLNHPHICHLYDIGSQDGDNFLVMEFLEGETLADRLRKGPLPLADIYKIGIAIADALAVAHKQGIVHRDLKPGNIMLTPGGAKLMDFGLAKPLAATNPISSSFAPSFTAAPTMSGPSPLSPLTQAGTIVGTFQYMSPEQIEGKETDARSDIFAFGAVLYEMTTGKRPFEGKSQISLASSILEKDPEPISTVKPLTPPAFEHVIGMCLQKNPDDRYQTAHDIKLELQWIASQRSAPVQQEPTQSAPRNPLLFAVIAAGILLAALAGYFLHRPAPLAPIVHTVINPPPGALFRLTDDTAGPPVLSPDGSQLAFTATGSDGKVTLWVRPMSSNEARSLPDTEEAIFPFWSPDSRFVAFFAGSKLKTIDLSNNVIQVLCDAQLGRGGAWGSQGVIVFSASPVSPIVQVSASGGTPIPVTKVDTAQHTSHRWPFFLPDGKHFLYLAMNHDNSRSANDAVYYASLDRREDRLLLRTQTNAIYVDGFLLFGRGDQLIAQPFDPDRGVLKGEPQTVVTGVMTDVATWHLDASASNNGLLVFANGANGTLQLVWADRTGKQLGVAADKLTNLITARLSPQGDRVALQLDPGTNDIWVLDLARGTRTRLTFGPIANAYPIWSPDGKWIAYGSLRDTHVNLYRKLADGSGAEELLLEDNSQGVFPTDWSRDGNTLLFSHGFPGGAIVGVWALPLDGPRTPHEVVPNGLVGRLSPNGRWLAYSSFESGKQEVYIVAYGAGQGKWQVSPNGGQFPQWSQDGKELYYVDGAQSIVATPVKETGGALEFGTTQTLISQWTILTMPFYDVTPDGKKLIFGHVAQQVSPSLTVVTNFTNGLKH